MPEPWDQGPDEDALDIALRTGLRAVPIPTASPDFDDRVLAALAPPASWWQRVWWEARPLLAGMTCSCVVVLGLISWSQNTPMASDVSRPGGAIPSVRPITMAALDQLLSRPNLSAGALAALTTATPLAPPPRGHTLPGRRTPDRSSLRRSPARRDTLLS